MNTFSAIKHGLLILGSFAIAYNISMLLHESCHLSAALLTGGTCDGLYINPFSWSYSKATSPNPFLLVMAGPFGSSILGVIPFYLAYNWYRPVLLPILLIGPVILIFNGGYLFIDTLMRSGGDGCFMIEKGLSPILIIIIAIALLLAGLGLSILVIRRTGMLWGDFKDRLITLSLGIMPYIAAMLIWNLFYNHSEIMLWLIYVVFGVISIVLSAIPPYRHIIPSNQPYPLQRKVILMINLFAISLISFFCLVF